MNLAYSERNLSPSPDDVYVENTVLYYADSMGMVSFNQVLSYLDSLGYEYTSEIGNDELAVIRMDCADGGLYFCFYPLDNSESSTEFGNPDREMLSCVEYSRDDKWVTVTDELHTGETLYRVGDKNDDPIAHYFSDIKYLIEYYNTRIGGFIPLN